MAEKTVSLAEFKRLYCATATPVCEIARRYGLTEADVRSQARKRKWRRTKRPRAVPLATPGAAKTTAGASWPAGLSAKKKVDANPAGLTDVTLALSPAAKKKEPPVDPKALVKRIYKTIEGELAKLEEQRGTSSQDRERSSRALAQVVNSFRNAVQMHNEMRKAKAAGRSAKDKEALADAEDLRKEIAERIERLRVQRGLAK